MTENKQSALAAYRYPIILIVFVLIGAVLGIILGG